MNQLEFNAKRRKPSELTKLCTTELITNHFHVSLLNQVTLLSGSGGVWTLPESVNGTLIIIGGHKQSEKYSSGMPTFAPNLTYPSCAN